MRSRGTCIAAIGAALACAVPAAAQSAVLVDQTNSPSANVSDSDDFNVDSADNQTADDFAVPPGQTWQISRMDVLGVLSLSPPAIANAFLYANSGALPGAELFHQSNIPATGAPNYSIPLSGSPTLGPGTYWVSFQQAGAGFMVPSWDWTDRTVQSGNPAVFRNPGGGSNSLCPDWATRYTTCSFTTNHDPDQLFRLSGTASSNPVNFGKLKRNTQNGTARLTVSVPGPGTLVLGGKGLVPKHLARQSGPGPAGKAVKVAGPVKLLIRAKGRSRGILNQRGKVQLRLTITYTATGADPISQKKKVLLDQG